MWRRDPSPERPEPEGAAPHTSRRVALFADPTDQSKIMIHVLRILIIDAHISSRFRPNGTARLASSAGKNSDQQGVISMRGVGVNVPSVSIVSMS